MELFFICALVVVAFFTICGFGIADTSGAVLGLFLGLVVCAMWFSVSFQTERTVKITVEGKERIAERNRGKWLVYAPNETFENTDAWFHGKTRSTDLQRTFKVGETYTCKVNGFRSGLLSRYRNILTCDD